MDDEDQRLRVRNFYWLQALLREERREEIMTKQTTPSLRRTHHQAGLIRAAVLFLAVAAVISCSRDATIYGDHNDTERSVCSAEGRPMTTSLSHGGYVTRCELPE
jgi:hypothetical protein